MSSLPAAGPGGDDYDEKYSDLDELQDREVVRDQSRGKRGRKRAARAPRRSGGERLRGRIISRSRGKFKVRVGDEVIPCFIRGSLAGQEAPVVGDYVKIVRERDHGVLETVEPRRNILSRISEEGRVQTRTLAANIDQLLIVLSIHPFPPRWVLADRLVVLGELEEFRSIIVLNKWDLVREEDLEEIEEVEAIYRSIGIPVLRTSATTGEGVEAFGELLEGQTSLLGGHSGVGKSSLLNAIHPEIDLAVGHVNRATGKGRHTTTLARLVELPSGGTLVDTPGFREFGLGDVEPAELGRCYADFRPFLGLCRFKSCLHVDEPDCGVLEALEAGKISNFRYGNYLQILSGLVERG